MATSEWRNRQTRQPKELVPARAWGFKSPLRHQQCKDHGVPTLQQLQTFAANVHSQFGEDGIIAEILDRIEAHMPLSRWSCEFGAADGVSRTPAISSGHATSGP